MYLPGDKVIYNNKECTVRFYYPKYKHNKNAYTVDVPNYRGFKSISILVYEEELCSVMYEQLSLF